MLIDQRQRQAYLAQGFLRIPRLVGEGDLSMLRAEWARLWQELDPSHPNIQQRGHVARGSTEDRIDFAYLLSPSLHRLCMGSGVTEVASALLGGPVALFKDKLISKGPGTHGYGLHQDWPYWTDYAVPADCMVSLMIPLDRCDRLNGALEVWPSASDVLPAPADDDPRDVDPAAIDLAAGKIVTLDPGDIMLLHPLAPHRSAPNRSRDFRRAYFVTYATAEYSNAADHLEAARLEML